MPLSIHNFDERRQGINLFKFFITWSDVTLEGDCFFSLGTIDKTDLWQFKPIQLNSL